MLSALLCAGLAGCAPAYLSKMNGTPGGDSADPLGAATAIWSDNGNELLLTLYGSSTCPAEPTSVTALDKSSINIELSTPSWPFCSADLAAVTYRIATPPSISTTGTVQVQVGDGEPFSVPGNETA